MFQEKERQSEEIMWYVFHKQTVIKISEHSAEEIGKRDKERDER